MTRSYHRDGTTPKQSNAVFVFGSNLAGRHGAGAALEAYRNWGAGYGCGVGPSGMSYAIPTKSVNLETLSLDHISDHVGIFIRHAKAHPECMFFVTRIGCVLAGHADADIAPLFRDAPANCSFAETWREHLEGVAAL
jgi:hypothetical protein